MGACSSSAKERHTVLMAGLDQAGKTTIIGYITKRENHTETIPTIGHETEELDFAGSIFAIKAPGGERRIRDLWKHYVANTSAVIFVVDATDVDRLPTEKKSADAECVRKDLNNLMGYDDLPADCPLLIFANKQDLKGALKPEEVKSRLKLESLEKSRPVMVMRCSAKTGDGLEEGFVWLTQTLRQQENERRS